MTLLECLYKFLITDDTALAGMLPGGLSPRLMPQIDVQTFQTMAVMRVISGVSEPPTHDSGVSCWPRVRLEFTVWGLVDRTNEIVAMYMMGKLRPFNGHLGGSPNGRFSADAIHGIMTLTDETSRLPGVQFSVMGLLNWSTLS